MDNTKELKPCPFCGARPSPLYQNGGGFMSALSCKKECLMWKRAFVDKSEVEAWNTRARPEPTEAMCDNARGFIAGLDQRRDWKTMQKHLSFGGYATLPYIEQQAKENPDGHITKWDIADCIYQLMNLPSTHTSMGGR